MTTESDNSDIDVCTVEEDCSHTGLTIVAAETYIESTTATTTHVKEQIVPLSEKDLLTKAKAEQIAKGKIAKKQEKYQKSINKTDTKPLKEVTPDNIKAVNKHLDVQQLNKSQIANNDKKQAVLSSVTKELLQKEKILSKKRQLEELENSELISSSSLQNHEDDLMDTGVVNNLKQFPLESEQLAIKNNSDYQKLLKTLAVLEAQRVQAIKDYEELNRLKDIAMADPLQFVKQIQEKTAPEIPKRQQIAKLPEINWLHYLTAYSNDTLIPQISTRNSSKENDPFDIDGEFDPFDDTSKDSTNPKSTNNEKHGTFNQKWSVEEQEKLEKLLVMYPPEEVEARRWEKIAKGLGTRTAQQVSSRIQKYFLKLAKARLPIPGRGPSSIMMGQSKKKLNPISYKRSTFFPSWQPSVFMKEDGDVSGGQNPDFFNEIQVSDEEDVSEEMRDTAEYKELMELKRIKRYKNQSRDQTSSGITMHTGFMCDGCSVDPIVGVRWHCADCPQENSVDFCTNCYQKPFETQTHSADHQLLPIYDPSEAPVDDSYTAFEQKKFKYNYLDPNFVPG